MGRRVITVTHPDGTKKVIVGKESSYNGTTSTSKPIPSHVNEKEDDTKKNRPKPGTPKVGLTHERNGYKKGGKIKFKAS